jgi:hypothetical protein
MHMGNRLWSYFLAEKLKTIRLPLPLTHVWRKALNLFPEYPPTFMSPRSWNWPTPTKLSWRKRVVTPLSDLTRSLQHIYPKAQTNRRTPPERWPLCLRICGLDLRRANLFDNVHTRAYFGASLRKTLRNIDNILTREVKPLATSPRRMGLHERSSF